MLIAILFGLLVLLNVVDIHSTYTILKERKGHEANKFVLAIMEWFADLLHWARNKDLLPIKMTTDVNLLGALLAMITTKTLGLVLLGIAILYATSSIIWILLTIAVFIYIYVVRNNLTILNK